MKYNLKKIGILGGGAWGTALSVVAAHRDRQVIIWSRNADAVQAINASHSNPLHLPGVTLPRKVTASTDFAALQHVDAIIIALPSQAVRDVLSEAAKLLPFGKPIIIASKGIEKGGRFLVGVVDRLIGAELFVLSGPSFAADVARQRPAAVVLAAFRHGAAEAMSFALATPSLRIYSTDDMAGVQLGGMIKNVLAIACGICDGMALGDSARAALVTRGSYEMARLGRKLGGRLETFEGLAGLGDLILTATSGQSRNYALGRALGEGKSLAAALERSAGVCEGMTAAVEMADAAVDREIDAPIIAAVAAIVAGTSTPRAEMERLMDRPLKSESPVT